MFTDLKHERNNSTADGITRMTVEAIGTRSSLQKKRQELCEG